MKNIGILLSGRGSNFDAIARNVEAGKIPAKIALVISNREQDVRTTLCLAGKGSGGSLKSGGPKRGG